MNGERLKDEDALLKKGRNSSPSVVDTLIFFSFKASEQPFLKGNECLICQDLRRDVIMIFLSPYSLNFLSW